MNQLPEKTERERERRGAQEKLEDNDNTLYFIYDTLVNIEHLLDR